MEKIRGRRWWKEWARQSVSQSARRSNVWLTEWPTGKWCYLLKSPLLAVSQSIFCPGQTEWKWMEIKKEEKRKKEKEKRKKSTFAAASSLRKRGRKKKLQKKKIIKGLGCLLKKKEEDGEKKAKFHATVQEKRQVFEKKKKTLILSIVPCEQILNWEQKQPTYYSPCQKQLARNYKTSTSNPWSGPGSRQQRREKKLTHFVRRGRRATQ